MWSQFNVISTLRGQNTDASGLAMRFCTVAIPASAHAGNAPLELKTVSTWIIVDVFRFAVGTSLPVFIVAARPATEQNRAPPPPLAICNVMFNVRIRSAPGVARSLAPHVQSRRVCHPVRIASVPCPALLHATIYLARDVVRNFLDAVINAHQFVERYVLHGS